jgi:hypothetical protein
VLAVTWLDGALSPAAFTAVTMYVYVVWLANPESMTYVLVVVRTV